MAAPMEVKMFVHVTGKEVFKTLSITDERRFDRMLAKFCPDDTVQLIANLCVMCGLFPETSSRIVNVEGVDCPINLYIQIRMSAQFLSPSIRDWAINEALKGRPIFFRQQLLFLLKKIVLLGSPDGTIKPQQNGSDWYSLGRMCLDITNFLDPERHESNTNAKNWFEQLRNSLIARLTPGFELLHPPSFQRGVVRSRAILRLFETKHPEFADGKSLNNFFFERQGVHLTTFFEITMAIYTHFLTVTDGEEIFEGVPERFRLDRSVYFRLLGIPKSELDAYFSLLARQLFQLKDEIKKDFVVTSYPHCDFTTFRRFPLLLLNEQVFTCLDIGFLLEKVSFGLFRTLHNSLPDDEKQINRKSPTLANRLSAYWGEAVESYFQHLLENAPGFFPDLTFDTGKGRSQQIDGLIYDGDSAAVIEVKAQYLTASAKYGSTDKLLEELNRKFGLKKRSKEDSSRGALDQLLSDIEKLFPKNVDVTGQARNFSCPSEFLSAHNIFPVLVIDETYLACPFVQWRLMAWFDAELKTRAICGSVKIHPLLVVSLEFLEAIEEPIKKGTFSFLEFCNFWKKRNESHLEFWQYDSWNCLMLYFEEVGIGNQRNSRVQEEFDYFMSGLMQRLATDN
jgi:hypothetical protein